MRSLRARVTCAVLVTLAASFAGSVSRVQAADGAPARLAAALAVAVVASPTSGIVAAMLCLTLAAAAKVAWLLRVVSRDASP